MSKKVKINFVLKEGFEENEPKQAYEGDAGFDLKSAEAKIVKPHTVELIKTGLFVEIPEGFEMQVRPRSGLALKNWITVENTPGTIDSHYRGEIGVILRNDGEYDFEVNIGDRIAQAVINELPKVQFVKVNKLSTTERGTGGFGSSGV